MSSLTVIIGLLVGLAAGILLVMIVDYYLLGKPLIESLKQKEQLQKAYQSTAHKFHQTDKSLTKSMAQVSRIKENLTKAEEQISEQVGDNQKLQQQLSEASSEIEVLHGNLNRVTDHADKLQQEIQMVCDKYETAVADNEELGEDLTLLQDEITTLQTENQAAYQEIAANETQIQHLTDQVAKLEPLAQKAIQFDAEKAALVEQIEKAEVRVSELKAMVSTMMGKLSVSDDAQKKVDEAEAKLQQAESKITNLQKKLNQMENHFEYTGKNQLQMIKGIGPTYAKRLNEAGINSFTDLSNQDPLRLKEIVQLKSWQNHDPTDWIEEALRLNQLETETPD
ncbi:MAG: helix-hairpin-helix domain-containing protein [Chloroflexota bacterium]